MLSAAMGAETGVDKSVDLKTNSFALLGVRYDNFTVPEALAAVTALLHRGEKAQVCFLNLDCVRQAQDDISYRHILDSSDLVFSDGVGLKVLTKLFGGQMRGNCNGTDLSPLIIEQCALKGYSVFFLGAEPGVADKAAKKMRQRLPSLKVAGVCNGFFTDASSVVEMINNSKADVLFVSMGVPLQEKWIASNRALLNPRLCLGVGALLDYLSAELPRAPGWMILLHIEWLWRVFVDPRRMVKRYFVNGFGFLFSVLFTRAFSRLFRRKQSPA